MEINDWAEQVRAKLRDRQALVGVVGLGYVGLPLSLAICDSGYRVLGFDIDEKKTQALSRSECYLRHLDEKFIRERVADGRLTATADFSRLDEPDVILICVPTPLTPEREPDLSHVESTARQIRDRLRPGQLVVLESTTYPGTTDDQVRHILDQSGLECGRDYFLAFSPEREDPGNERFRTTDVPKVVGGVEAVSAELAVSFYASVFASTVKVSSARTAEATKLAENVFRAVNIALVNELKIIYGRMGIDIWEVLDAAATKPFGFMRFDPGPGWGGHCIPVDPYYLSWKARQYGDEARFVELAGEINRRMPAYVVERLRQSLAVRGKQLRGSRVLVIGIAYKRNVSDLRESPAFEVIETLLELGAEVSFHDPHVAESVLMRSWPNLPRMQSRPLEEATANDAVIIVTDHAAVDYEWLANHASLIIDTRGVYRDKRDNVVPA